MSTDDTTPIPSENPKDGLCKEKLPKTIAIGLSVIGSLLTFTNVKRCSLGVALRRNFQSQEKTCLTQTHASVGSVFWVKLELGNPRSH